jgi:uncharacterized membrane protein YdjX (TVP38/TMEM64 family)
MNGIGDGEGDGIMEPSRSSNMSLPSGSFRTRLILIGLFAAALAAFYLTGLYEYFRWDVLKEHRDSWRQIIDQNRTSAAILFVVLSVALMSLSLPVGSVLSLTAGALFDLWLGVGLVAISSAFGCTFAFLISRYLLRDFVRHWFGRWLRIVDPLIHRDGASYLLMLRLSPVVPFFALNAVMGLTHIELRKYIAVSLVGMLPSCFLYTLVGTEIMRIESPKDIISTELVVLLSLLAFMPLLFSWFFRRRVKEATKEPQV